MKARRGEVKQYSVIGTEVPGLDARGKATGVDDVILPNMS